MSVVWYAERARAEGAAGDRSMGAWGGLSRIVVRGDGDLLGWSGNLFGSLVGMHLRLF